MPSPKRKKLQYLLEVPLRKFQSLWLHIREGNASISTSPYSQSDSLDNDTSNSADTETREILLPEGNTTPKLSIKKQIKSIIKAYGVVPFELSYDDIRSSMTKTHIRKYGIMARKFVARYNAKILSMKLHQKRKMSLNYSFDDILALSRFVNQSPSSMISELVSSLNEDSIKQLLLNSLSYYLQNSNFEKYLNRHNDRSKLHHSIVNKVKTVVDKQIEEQTLQHQEHLFDRLVCFIRLLHVQLLIVMH